jgi:ADP-heptose:LPS heptosyltransferase
MEKINLKKVLSSSCAFKIKCIKVFDYIAGGFFSKLLTPIKKDNFHQPIDIAGIKKILIIRPGGIGDAVLSFPFMRELRRTFDAKLDLLADKRNREIFNLVPGLINKIFCYNQGNILTLVLKLRRERYDVIFDTEQWHNFSAIIAYLLGAKFIVGFNTRQSRSKFYTHQADYAQDEYEAYSFLNLLSVFVPHQIKRELAIPFIEISDTSSTFPDSLDKDKKKIALCMSASIPERRWPLERLRNLIDILLSKGFCVLLIGGRKEISLVNSVIKDLGNKNLFNFVGKFKLEQTVAFLKSCDIFIGFDSGILHLACGLGLSAISLFGAGIKEKWALRYNRHTVLHKNLSCSPCTVFSYTSHCPKGAECMRLITVDDVLSAVEGLISMAKDD